MQTHLFDKCNNSVCNLRDDLYISLLFPVLLQNIKPVSASLFDLLYLQQEEGGLFHNVLLYDMRNTHTGNLQGGFYISLSLSFLLPNIYSVSASVFHYVQATGGGSSISQCASLYELRNGHKDSVQGGHISPLLSLCLSQICNLSLPLPLTYCTGHRRREFCLTMHSSVR